MRRTITSLVKAAEALAADDALDMEFRKEIVGTLARELFNQADYLEDTKMYDLSVRLYKAIGRPYPRHWDEAPGELPLSETAQRIRAMLAERRGSPV